MRIVLLTGTHPRHAFVRNCLESTGQLVGVLIERREEFVPTPPTKLDPGLTQLFERHFRNRSESESRFFSPTPALDVRSLVVDTSDLNSGIVSNFLNECAPDLLLSYGVHKISDETLSLVSSPLKWNIHGGLSPWYRGVATNFWPSYFLEPQMTGMTVHELTSDIDGGRIIHQVTSDLVKDDGIHDLANRAVRKLGQDLPTLVSKISDESLSEPVSQRTTGRIWRGLDWRPEHLRPIYQLYEDRIVDLYLQGELEVNQPSLITQF
jgi:folate-dependent phosphoribosylglycinamide formyltransferase PurN